MVYISVTLNINYDWVLKVPSYNFYTDLLLVNYAHLFFPSRQRVDRQRKYNQRKVSCGANWTLHAPISHSVFHIKNPSGWALEIPDQNMFTGLTSFDYYYQLLLLVVWAIFCWIKNKNFHFIVRDPFMCPKSKC